MASLLIGIVSVQPVKAQAAYKTWVKDIYKPALLSNQPYGKINVIIGIYKLLYDGSSTYDWYYYLGSGYANDMLIESVPGDAIPEWTQYDWRTADHGEAFYVHNPGTYRWLVDYDPTNTDGSSSGTISASVSVSGGGGSLGISYTYPIPWIRVDSYSDISIHRAAWVHDFNEQVAPEPGPTTLSQKVSPAFVVRTLQNTWTFVDAQFDSYWAHKYWDWIYLHWMWEWSPRFWSSWVYMDAYRYGDS